MCKQICALGTTHLTLSDNTGRVTTIGSSILEICNVTSICLCYCGMGGVSLSNRSEETNSSKFVSKL